MNLETWGLVCFFPFLKGWKYHKDTHLPTGEHGCIPVGKAAEVRGIRTGVGLRASPPPPKNKKKDKKDTVHCVEDELFRVYLEVRGSAASGVLLKLQAREKIMSQARWLRIKQEARLQHPALGLQVH